MKKILSIMVCFILISCGSNKQDSDTVTLRFSWWGGDARHQAYLDTVKLFEAENPDIKIKSEYSGWDGHYDRLITQIAGDVAPDVMQVDWNWLFALGTDKFYDLSTTTIDFSGYDQAAIDNVTEDSKVLAVPYGDGISILVYNKTIFDQVGLPIPKSYADLRNAAKVLKEKLGDSYYPLGTSGKNADRFTHARYYVEQKYGVPFITGKKVTYTEDQFTEGLEFALSLQDDGVLPSAQSRDSEGVFDITQHPRWAKGQYAGTMTWAATARALQGAIGDMELVVGDFPRDLGEYPAAFVRSAPVFVINSQTKHAEAAAKFLDFFVNNPEANKLINTQMGLPGNTKAQQVLFEANIIDKSDPTYIATEKLKGNRGPLVSPYLEHAEPKQASVDIDEKLSYKLMTPREAAQGIIQAYNNYLSQQ